MAEWHLASACKAPPALKTLRVGMGVGLPARWGSGPPKEADPQLLKAMSAVSSAHLRCMEKTPSSLRTLWYTSPSGLLSKCEVYTVSMQDMEACFTQLVQLSQLM